MNHNELGLEVPDHETEHLTLAGELKLSGADIRVLEEDIGRMADFRGTLAQMRTRRLTSASANPAAW
jgi:hypothetical protein